MDEVLLKFANHMAVKNTLPDCLQAQPVGSLCAQAEVYGLNDYKKLKKAELVALLTQTILDQLLYHYIYFTPAQEAGFCELLAGDLTGVSVVDEKYLLLYIFGFAHYFYADNTFVLHMPDEVKALFLGQTKAKQTQLAKNKNEYQDFYKYTVALSKKFGAFTAADFILVYNAHFEKKVTAKKYEAYLHEMAEKQLQFSVQKLENGKLLVTASKDEDSRIRKQYEAGKIVFNPAILPEEIEESYRFVPSVKKQPVHVEKIGRNEPCLCGSGKKYKKCCG